MMFLLETNQLATRRQFNSPQLLRTGSDGAEPQLTSFGSAELSAEHAALADLHGSRHAQSFPKSPAPVPINAVIKGDGVIHVAVATCFYIDDLESCEVSLFILQNNHLSLMRSLHAG